MTNEDLITRSAGASPKGKPRNPSVTRGAHDISPYRGTETACPLRKRSLTEKVGTMSEMEGPKCKRDCPMGGPFAYSFFPNFLIVGEGLLTQPCLMQPRRRSP